MSSVQEGREQVHEGDKPHNMRVAQVNLDRSATATDELRVWLSDHGADIVLIQEPYVVRERICGLGDLRVLCGGGSGPPMAAVGVWNRALRVTLLSHLSSRHIVVVAVERDGSAPVYLVSVYCQFSLELTGFLRSLGEALQALRGSEVVIGADTNAWSRLWFSHHFSEFGPAARHRRPWTRGAEFEDFILEHDLVVANVPGVEPSFHGAAGGQSNIDVTLATHGLSGRIVRWTMRSDVTVSQHSFIVFAIQERRVGPEAGPSQKGRFCEKKANWERYEEALTERLRATQFPDIGTRRQLEEAVDTVTGIIIESASDSMPVQRVHKGRPSWWSMRLDRMRKKVAAIKHRVRRARRRVNEELKTQYHAVRREYTKAVRKSRTVDWRNFVTEEGIGQPWGAPYRIVRREGQRFQMAVLRGVDSITWGGAAKGLLDALFPDDFETDENDQQIALRAAATVPARNVGGVAEPVLAKELLDRLVRSFKPGKAPGMDRVEIRTLQRGWDLLYPWFITIFQKCLELGVFPAQWKVGKLCVLKKPGDRDPADPKGYRPLCLLSVPGKLLEKVMVSRLDEVLTHASPAQHGFRKGRSTISAVATLEKIVKDASEKYVLGIFVDIRGAFDNVWWPGVLSEMRKRDCDPQLYNLLLDYFDGRKVVYTEGSQVVSKGITKGCPQGSVLGPYLWNVLFDAVLAALELDGYDLIAYADDLAIMIRAPSRALIEDRACRAMTRIGELCGAFKLTIAREKTVMMLLKGLMPSRNPIVRIGGESLAYVTQFKYLGITLQERMFVDSHVALVCDKALAAFMKVSRLAGSEWGIRYQELLILYKGLFLGILLYGVQAWAHLLKKRHWAKLASAQRRALLKVCRAYRTAPTSAMPVLAGVLPVRLEAWRRWSAYRIGRKKEAVVPGVWAYDPDTDTRPRGTILKELNDALLETWQQEWDVAETGRLPHRLMSGVRDRLDWKWLKPTHHLTQLVLGHGEFATKLASFQLMEDQPCECGHPEELAEHILLDCEVYRAARERCGLQGVPIGRMLSSPARVDGFETFANEVIPALRLRHVRQQAVRE